MDKQKLISALFNSPDARVQELLRQLERLAIEISPVVEAKVYDDLTIPDPPPKFRPRVVMGGAA